MPALYDEGVVILGSMVRGVTLFWLSASHASRGMASGTWPKPGRGARWVILAIHTCIGHLLRLKRASRRPQGQRSCDSSKLHTMSCSPSSSGRGTPTRSSGRDAATVVLGHAETHGFPGCSHGILGLCAARPVLFKPSRWSPQGDSSWAVDRLDGSLCSDIQAGGCSVSWKQDSLP